MLNVFGGIINRFYYCHQCGFSALAEKKGVYVIDCDKIARQVTEGGSECLLKLAEVFGEDIIKEGELDRKLLASRAFSDENKKQLLEDTIFPFILKNSSNAIWFAICPIILPP